jgi:hypothetical protein
MAFVIKKATRTMSKMRIGLFGPSGSGKTMSALRLAKGLVGEWSKIVVIDAENGSADLYSQLGDYSTLTLEAPFSPQRYNDAIKACEQGGFECIVIDSISHEWEGAGGCLDIHAKLGGKFETWAKVTPLHNSFIQAIVQSSCHVITTGRSKIDYNFEGKSVGGKGKVEKVGLKTVTRDGFDYEMTLAFQINQEHLATTDKDRTGMFNDVMPFLITEEIGVKIRTWNDQGAVKTVVAQTDPLVTRIFELIARLTDGFKDDFKIKTLLKEMNVNSSNEIKALVEADKLECIAFLESKIEEEKHHAE